MKEKIELCQNNDNNIEISKIFLSKFLKHPIKFTKLTKKN